MGIHPTSPRHKGIAYVLAAVVWKYKIKFHTNLSNHVYVSLLE